MYVGGWLPLKASVILPYKCAVYTDNHDVNNLDNKIQYNINVTVVFDSSCEVKMMIILSN